LIGLFAGLLALATYLFQWPYKNVAIIAIATVGTAIVSGLLFRLLRYWRESTAARQEEDSLSAVAKQKIKRMEAIWEAAIERIRHSRLKERGDPIYVIPWYLMLGESGSGKTTALNNSRVGIPCVEGRVAPSKTDDVGNWWLMDESIVIDTPGRYSFPIDDVDELEWQRFKKLFLKYRKSLPLNGVIIAISVKRIVQSQPNELKIHATQLRGRLGELIQSLGVRFPVYILITQCDQIAGYTPFFDQFPEAVTSQAMGELVRLDELSIDQRVNQIFWYVEKQLMELRLSLLAGIAQEDLTAALFTLPEQIDALRRPTRTLVKSLLDTAYYAEAPLFRGIYFGSGHQEGVPISNCLNVNGESHDLMQSSGWQTGERSLFLKGYFGKVLNQDKNLVRPTHQAVNWNKLRQNLGVAIWASVCLLIGLGLSASFYFNMDLLRNTDRALPGDMVIKNKVSQDLVVIDEFRQVIQGLHDKHSTLWLTNLGLNHSHHLAKRFEQEYGKRFKKAILDPFTQRFNDSLSRLSEKTPPQDIANYVGFMTQHIKLLQTAVKALADEQPQRLSEIPLNDDFMLFHLDRDIAQQTQYVNLLQSTYRAYLQWVSHPKMLAEDLQQVESQLMTWLGREEIGLSWLIDWANLKQNLNEVSMRDYWGRSYRPSNETPKNIPRAFTPAGWQAIYTLLEEITHVVQNSEQIQQKRHTFIAHYQREYFRHWQALMTKFHVGAQAWRGDRRQLELAALLSSDNSPYLKLLSDVNQQLAPMLALESHQESIPAWVPLVARFNKLMQPDYQKNLQSGGGMMDTLVDKGSKALGKMKSLVQGIDTNDAIFYEDKKAYPLVNLYFSSLAQLGEQTQSTFASYETVQRVAIELDKLIGEPEQIMNRNEWAKKQLKKIVGQNQMSENIFWHLLDYQAKQLWWVLVSEAEKYLEQLWQTEVLAHAEGLTGWQKIDELQGPNGKIWEFQDSYAKPFLVKHRRRGYLAKEIYSQSIHFSRSFLQVLNQGKVSQQAISGVYQVDLQARPTSANRDARELPKLTKLTMQCASGNTEFENYNFPKRITLNWSPQDCGDVSLEIHVGRVVLTKNYTGYNAFIRFLKDFKTGTKTFYPKDFPDYRGELATLGINQMTVSYIISGQSDVLRLATKNPSTIPNRIISR